MASASGRHLSVTQGRRVHGGPSPQARCSRARGSHVAATADNGRRWRPRGAARAPTQGQDGMPRGWLGWRLRPIRRPRSAMAETKGKQPAGGGEGAMRGGSDNDGPAGQPPAMAARYWAASEGEIEGEDGVVNEGRQPESGDDGRAVGGRRRPRDHGTARRSSGDDRRTRRGGRARSRLAKSGGGVRRGRYGLRRRESLAGEGRGDGTHRRVRGMELRRVSNGLERQPGYNRTRRHCERRLCGER